jgi:2-octaprenyl-6-methoxyphenol hydroxylase
MNSLYDVVIIGGGLVGASLAAALRHTPLKVALLEAGHWSPPDAILPSSYDERVLALNYASQRILHSLGVWEKVSALATPIKHIQVSDQGHFGKARLHCEEIQLPALGYVIAARQLGQALQQILQQGKVEIQAKITVTDFKQHADFIELQCLQADTTCLLKSRVVIIADGSDSQLREKLGLVTTQQDYGQTAIIANVSLEKSHQYTAFERFTAKGPLALLPLANQDCSLVWTVPPEEVQTKLTLSKREFLAALQSEFGWKLGAFTHVGTRHAYPLRLVRTPQSVSTRSVVIGNAAHTLHPIAGQGFNLGLRDVASLSDILLAAHQAGQDLGSASVLNAYAAIQQPDQARVAGVTNSLVQVFSNNLLGLRQLRSLGLLALDRCAPLKRHFMRQMTGLNAYPSQLLCGVVKK